MQVTVSTGGGRVCKQVRKPGGAFKWGGAGRKVQAEDLVVGRGWGRDPCAPQTLKLSLHMYNHSRYAKYPSYVFLIMLIHET